MTSMNIGLRAGQVWDIHSAFRASRPQTSSNSNQDTSPILSDQSRATMKLESRLVVLAGFLGHLPIANGQSVCPGGPTFPNTVKNWYVSPKPGLSYLKPSSKVTMSANLARYPSAMHGIRSSPAIIVTRWRRSMGRRGQSS